MSDSLAKLKEYKHSLDTAIDGFCERLLADAGRYTPYSREATDALCAVLRRGGKRLRGALVLNAYEMVGGGDRQLALRAAVAVEVVHAYLLITDDICDRSATRRGGRSAHRILADYHAHEKLHGDSEHFGVSIAINAAMLGAHSAMLELAALPVDDKKRLAVLTDVNTTLVRTIHGQFNDIFNEARQAISEAEVKQVLTWKTAYYSFLSPMRVGMLLDGADADSKVVAEYAERLGLAFQIIDDILGTFGNEFESGKSATDDMKEGKVTLMVAYALKQANAAQRRDLLAGLGNRALDDAGFARCKEIIEETGALDYARGLAQGYANDAVAALKKAPNNWQVESVSFLRGLAEFVVKRSA